MPSMKPSHTDEPSPRTDLLPKSQIEAITFMLKAFGEFPDQIRLNMYIETLKTCTTDEVWEAVKQWARLPHERAAKAGELLSMILQVRDRLVEAREQQARQKIAAAPPTDAHGIDAIYEELIKNNPDNAFLRHRIAERSRLRALGQSLNGQQEVAEILAHLGDRKTIP